MRSIFDLIRYAERAFAYAQGKGYGSATVRQEVNSLLSMLPGPPKLAIDMGGNIGDYTAELRRRVPGLEIHVFEPASVNVDRLSSRFADDQLIKIFPHAVSDKGGKATLHSDVPGSGFGSLTKRRLDHFGIDFEAKESVQSIRFEDHWRDHLDCREIDIVKMDIEGHELHALHGFGDALAATKVIQFEFGGCNIDTRTYFQDFWYFFADAGFHLFRITPFGAQRIGGYREQDEFFGTTNYIAVRD